VLLIVQQFTMSFPAKFITDLRCSVILGDVFASLL
jgi:hypothetical protein